MRSEEDQEMRAPFMRRSGQPSLQTSPGLHRVVWDMTIDTEGRSPLALPGTYTFRLSVGDRVETRSADLLMDPRVAADGVTMADLQEQYDLILAVNETTARAREVAERVRAGVGRAEGEAKAAFEALQARMVDDPVGSYPRPMLLGQLGYLSGMIGRADQKPGADAYVRHQQLIDELDDIERELARLERLIA
jgi:hypothetical protein